MFSLIQRVLRAARSLDAVSERLTKLESQVDKIAVRLDKFEKLAAENESLWQFLEEQKEMEDLFAGVNEDFQEELTDLLVRNMKVQGDA